METKQFTKACKLLAHPKRSLIFTYVLEDGPIKVQDVAKKFDIHPNMARNHLNILEELNLLKSKYSKQKVGAPSKTYSAVAQFICLNFPRCPLSEFVRPSSLTNLL
ncbi:MAG: ArsR family transcriptional regulator [Actinobacteria bacterium]|nr:MAG: ArsR family transcriptional regulator [Actinomycetota bacterium]